MYKLAPSVAAVILCVCLPRYSMAQSNTLPKLQFRRWSGGLNVPDPVAISFDTNGTAYVTQTQRRKIQDLDIRQHRQWIEHDVALQSVQDKLEFYQRELAPGNDQSNAKHVADHNGDGKHDYRDLTVISERIHRIEDTDGDGTADTIETFADDFRTPVTGIAAGVLAHQGDVYATIAPDVWRMRDVDGDHHVDERTKIATGFGLHIAYAGHDMHGLTIGPDGKIYWSIGDKGISVTSSKGKRFHFPNQGGVLRCNPDGSDFEVFAHGLRNVQELAFDQFGNLFGVDNDADKPGERERFVYIVKGHDAGWRCNYQYRGSQYDPWMAEHLWVPFRTGQPAYIIPPIAHSIDGPAGFAFNPGTALSDSYKDYFFLTGAPGGTQIAFQAVADGASFAMKNTHTIGKGTPLVGINFGPDGALYGVDWGGGYPLNQKGAIWQIDVAEDQRAPRRREVHELLAADVSNDSANDIRKLLSHPDQRVRLKAQFELVARREIKQLHAAVAESQPRLSRIHGVWGLGQLATLGENTAVDQLKKLLFDRDEEVVANALRVLGDTRVSPGIEFTRLLQSKSPRIQFFALQCLGIAGSRDDVAGILAYADQLKMEQVYLRFALSQALEGAATSQQLAGLAKHENKIVQLAAVIALRRRQDPAVAAFLDGVDDDVASEVARAIHDDFSIPEALPQLAAQLSTGSRRPEAFVRRSIHANFRLGKAEHAVRLAQFANETAAEQSMRHFALRCLQQWKRPPRLDLVTGRARRMNLESRDYQASQLSALLSRLMNPKQAAIATLAMQTARMLDLEMNTQSLLSMATSAEMPIAVRLEAFRTAKADPAASTQEVIDLWTDSSNSRLRMEALTALAEQNLDGAIALAAQRARKATENEERQHAVNLLSKVKTADSKKALLDLLKDYDKAENSAVRLEVLEAAARSTDDELQRTLANIREQQESADDRALAYRECLVGGDVAEGKRIFMTHIGAQCIRCHRIGKQGSQVGPRLDDVAKRRDSLSLLRSIVAPAAEMEPKYQSQIVVLLSGEVIRGLPLETTDEKIVLADAQGKAQEILKDDIDIIQASKSSIMPQMDEVLTRREIRNLVAYLKTLTKQQ